MELTPSEQLIIDTLLSQYMPATVNDENIELLSTTELINQFQGIAVINTNLISDCLAGNGFKLLHTGEDYKWILKQNNF